MPQTPIKSRAIANSARLPAMGAVAIGAAEPGAKLTVTLRLRQRPGAPPLPSPGATAGIPAKSRHYLLRKEYEQQHGAAPADLASVKGSPRRTD